MPHQQSMKPSTDKSRSSASSAKTAIKTTTELRKSRIEPSTRIDRGTKTAPRPDAKDPQSAQLPEPRREGEQTDTPVLPAQLIKPAYVLPEDPGAVQRSVVHFSAAAGTYISLAAPLACPKETASSSSEPRIPGRNRPGAAEENTGSLGEGDQSLPVGRKLRNKLSFIDRAAQTQHWPSKERDALTQQLHVEHAAGSCSSWEIRDAYVAAAAAGAGSSATSDSTSGQRALQSSKQIDSPSRRAHYITSVVQRMLFQNLHPDIATDFKVSVKFLESSCATCKVVSDHHLFFL